MAILRHNISNRFFLNNFYLGINISLFLHLCVDDDEEIHGGVGNISSLVIIHERVCHAVIHDVPCVSRFSTSNHSTLHSDSIFSTPSLFPSLPTRAGARARYAELCCVLFPSQVHKICTEHLTSQSTTSTILQKLSTTYSFLTTALVYDQLVSFFFRNHSPIFLKHQTITTNTCHSSNANIAEHAISLSIIID